MRTQLVTAGLFLLLATGFRCPGSEPTLDPTTGVGGAGGRLVPPDVSSAGGMTSTTGGVGGVEPPLTFCEVACQSCDRPGVCRAICEVEESTCGPAETKTCFDAHPCSLLDSGVCLAADQECPPTMELACKVLCYAMLSQCTDARGAYVLQGECETRCELGFDQECFTQNGQPPPPGDVLACGANSLVAGCNEGELNTCIKGLCSAEPALCPSTWIYDDSANAPCPVSSTN